MSGRWTIDRRRLYGLADGLTVEEKKVLGLGRKSSDRPADVQAVRLDIRRPPRAGEWYLHGKNPRAYRAGSFLVRSYPICYLVLVEKITEYQVVKECRHVADSADSSCAD